MDLKDLRHRYERHYAPLGGESPSVEAARIAVGGDFDATGALEFYALKAHGLTPESFVVDVGCGTGRLAVQLARRGYRRYAGFDIIGSAVEFARTLCEKPEWEFGVTDGLRIPVKEAVADFVCFFSVFTHVSHEHTYLYLGEASRVLRTGGVAIFTFLEFGIPCHWEHFQGAVERAGGNLEPIVFLSRDAIAAFASHQGFEVVNIVDGDKPTFPIEEQIVTADGRVLNDRGYLGQSLAILRKR